MPETQRQHSMPACGWRRTARVSLHSGGKPPSGNRNYWPNCVTFDLVCPETYPSSVKSSSSSPWRISLSHGESPCSNSVLRLYRSRRLLVPELRSVERGLRQVVFGPVARRGRDPVNLGVTQIIQDRLVAQGQHHVAQILQTPHQSVRLLDLWQSGPSPV